MTDEGSGILPNAHSAPEVVMGRGNDSRADLDKPTE